MNRNRVPSQVKIIGHEPDSRGASLKCGGPARGLLGSFWISPFGHVMRTVSMRSRVAEAEDERHAW